MPEWAAVAAKRLVKKQERGLVMNVNRGLVEKESGSAKTDGVTVITTIPAPVQAMSVKENVTGTMTATETETEICGLPSPVTESVKESEKAENVTETTAATVAAIIKITNARPMGARNLFS